MHDVYLIGKTGPEDLNYYLQEEFDHSISCGKESVAEVAARRCYKSFKPGLNPNVTKTRDDPEEFWLNILKSGHGSVLEHIQATFAFEGVSRVFTHELVRHRAGCAYSQESMRYVRFEDFDMWMPPEIQRHCKANAIWRHTHKELQRLQKELQTCWDFDSMPFAEKKAITSALRRLLPIGISTGIIASFNLRALRHIIRMRTCLAAEVEIRIVFNKVAQICVETWPNIFQDFTHDDRGVWESEYPT